MSDHAIPAVESTIAAPAPATGPRPGAFWAAALGAGLLAGLAAWAGGEAVQGRFRPMVTTVMGPGADEETRKLLAGIAKEAAFAYAILAGAVGLVLGAAGGLARRSARGAAVGGLVGLVAGLAAEGAVAAILLPIAGQHRVELNEGLLLPVMLLGGIWAMVGLAGGLGFGAGLGGRNRVASGAAGGLVGALLGTVGFLVLGAVALPLAEASSPIPITGAARLLARLAVALGAALGAALAIQATAARPPAVPAAST